MACPFSCYFGLVCRCGCADSDGGHSGQQQGADWWPDPRRTVHVLLLGAAETGKSTIMRQMKIIHDGEMSPGTLRRYTRHVLSNVHTCASRLVAAAQEAKLSWHSPEAQKAAEVLIGVTAGDWGLEVPTTQEEEGMTVAPHLPEEHARLITLLWQDETATECWQRASEFNLPQSTAYFLGEVKRFASKPFRPTQQDVLCLRLPTHSETIYDFRYDNWTFRITDVGGQRGVRRRWIRLFDGVNAIIFLASLSEFDQHSDEDAGMNRLMLSRSLFRETVQFQGFQDTAFILFLNKRDVLASKLSQQPRALHAYFPEYQGPPGDAHEAALFIEEQFKQTAERFCRRPFVHHTCATDTEQTRFVFAAVREHIIFCYLRSITGEIGSLY